MTNRLRNWLTRHVDTPLTGLYARLDERYEDEAALRPLLPIPRAEVQRTATLGGSVGRHGRRHSRRVAH